VRAPDTSPKPSSSRRPAPGISLSRRRIDIVRIKSYLVVDLAFLGIAENVIRLGESLELFLRGLVSRINVRMVFPRQLAKRLANLSAEADFFTPRIS